MKQPARAYLLAVIGIVAAALAVRLLAGLWWQQRLPEGSTFTFGDSHSYWILGEKIAEGEPYTYGPGQSPAYRTPGYPVLLATLFVLRDDPPILWARALNAILGALAVGAVIWLTRQRFAEPVSLIAGALAAVYPGAVGMSVFVLTEAPFCLLMLLQIIAWTAAARAPGRRRMVFWAAVAGVAAGLATLVRPSWLLFTPMGALIAVVGCKARQRQLIVAGTMMLSFAVVMSPWWVRNYRLYGRFVPTTMRVGASLYDGLNPEATGASDMAFTNEFYQQQKRVDAARDGPSPGRLDERLDGRMRRAAIQWARQNPGRVLQLMGIKFLRMWSPWPHADEMQSWEIRLLLLLSYPPLMLLAAAGALRYARQGWPAVLCLLPAFYFTALHMVFVSSIRYRQPAMLPLIVLAAGMLVSRARACSDPRRGAEK